MLPIAPRLRPLALLAAAALLLAGCSDITVVKSATAPGVTSVKFNKVFIVALARQELNRRIAEHRVASLMTKVTPVISSDILPGVLAKGDKDRLLKAVHESGADGLVVLRLTSSETVFSRAPNNHLPMDYMTFSGYYGSVYDVGGYYATAESSITADRVYLVETTVYDVKTEKLLWSCVTQSTKDNIEAQNVGALSLEVAKTLKSVLVDNKLLN